MVGRGSRGWGAFVALAFAVLTFWVGGDPLALVGFPLALLLLVLPPRRPAQYALAAVALGVGLMGASSDSIWLLDRGWALLLGAWFLLLVLALPRARFLERALGAVGATAASGTLLLLLRPGALPGLDRTLAANLRDMATQTVAAWKGSGAQVPQALVDMLYRVVDLRALLAPALAGLASLAALAMGWWLYRRLALPEERPLPPLREFRFRDELVWLLVAGIVLVVVPGIGHGALRAGSNLLTFMGALYALRGVAVLVALAGGGLGVGGALLAVLAVLSIPPLVMAAAVLVGLTDTWLDLRARVRPSPGK